MAESQFMNGGNSEVQDKQALSYLLAASTTTGIAASGVIEGLVVAQTATASGSVLISAGAAVNQASLGQGADLLVNDTSKTLDIFTANPMGALPRNDIVTFDSVTSAIIVVVGTPNATPTDPTVATTQTSLARLRHAASATTIPTAKIDDLRAFTRLRGAAFAVVATVTANSDSTSGNTDLVLATAPAITLDGSTLVQIEFSWFSVAQTVGTDAFQVRIYSTATAGTGTVLSCAALLTGADNGTLTAASGPVRSVITPTAGAHTYSARLVRTAGGGTAMMNASATSPAVITVSRMS